MAATNSALLWIWAVYYIYNLYFSYPDNPRYLDSVVHSFTTYYVKSACHAQYVLQVINPESFDSIDSDTGTLVPSAGTSPCLGMSPNTSRNNSLSVIPAMESFELEEVNNDCEFFQYYKMSWVGLTVLCLTWMCQYVNCHYNSWTICTDTDIHLWAR